jgi:hypothetical protein
MNPHARSWKMMKWASAAVCMVLVGVWVASAWWWIRWERSDGGWIGVLGGSLLVTSDGPERVGLVAPGLHALRWHGSFHWLPMHILSRTPFVLVPLWPIALIFVVPTLIAWRLDTLARRRARIGNCTTCNYDRRGLPGASPCPECGAVPATTPT